MNGAIRYIIMILSFIIPLSLGVFIIIWRNNFTFLKDIPMPELVGIVLLVIGGIFLYRFIQKYRGK